MPSGSVQELMEQTGLPETVATELLKFFPNDIVAAILWGRDPFNPNHGTEITNDRLVNRLQDEGYIRELVRHVPWLSQESAANLKKNFPNNNIRLAILLAQEPFHLGNLLSAMKMDRCSLERLQDEWSAHQKNVSA